MNETDARARWGSSRGKEVVKFVLLAVAGGEWVDEIYKFTNSSPDAFEVDLSGICIPPGTDLKNSDWSCLKLEFADFSQCDLEGSNMQQSVLNHATFVSTNLRKSNMVGCSARFSSFERADLSDAFAMGADLTSSNFSGTNLSRCALSGTVGRDANFMGAIFDGADLDTADWTGARVDHNLAKIARSEMASLPTWKATESTPRESLDTLIAKRKAIEDKIAAFRNEEKATTIAEIRRLLAEYNIALADLSPGKRRSRKKPDKKPVDKYRDVVTGKKWTGRGSRPQWLVEALAKGKLLDDFKV